MEGTAVQEQAGTLCVDVVEAVAAEAGADPLALSPPLYDVVDTEALARLVRSGTDLTVEFDYAGYAVAVDSDGTVAVRDDAERPGALDAARGERA